MPSIMRKAKSELGYAPARDLATGLRATLDWYLDNTRWWQALLGRDYAAWIGEELQALADPSVKLGGKAALPWDARNAFGVTRMALQAMMCAGERAAGIIERRFK